MLRIFFFLFCILCNNISFAEEDKQKLLNAEIAIFNDQHDYEKSIIKLEEIITDPKASAYDLYNAYFQKYLTYKRLFNYTEALNNLDLALESGLKSKEKEEIKKRIQIERMFIHFDLLEFDKVSELLINISRKDFARLDKETEAFYLSILGTMSIRAQNYVEAEKYLDEALIILEQHAPKHLPLIYRKKIGLKKGLKQYKEAVENFERGLFYAEKYKMDIYIIAMYSDISSFYSDIGDVKNALRTQHILNKLATEYDNTNRSGKLHLLEKKLIKKKQEQNEKESVEIALLLTVLSLILIVSLIVIVYFYRSNKKKRIEIEIENSTIQDTLDKVVLEMKELNTPKNDLTDFNLTERQREIILLVKEGKTNKEIGNELFISENTVKYHLKVIYDTLKINKRSEL